MNSQGNPSGEDGSALDSELASKDLFVDGCLRPAENHSDASTLVVFQSVAKGRSPASGVSPGSREKLPLRCPHRSPGSA